MPTPMGMAGNGKGSWNDWKIVGQYVPSLSRENNDPNVTQKSSDLPLIP